MSLGNTIYKIVFHDRKTVPSKEYLSCPCCGGKRSQVAQTSAAHFEDMKGVGRHRTCYDCDHEFRTLEVIL